MDCSGAVSLAPELVIYKLERGLLCPVKHPGLSSGNLMVAVGLLVLPYDRVEFNSRSVTAACIFFGFGEGERQWGSFLRAEEFLRPWWIP